MRARQPGRDLTEAALPAALRIPFDQWSPLKWRLAGRRVAVRVPAADRGLSIPAAWLGHRAWLEISDGKCVGGSCAEPELGGPWGGWLLYAEKIGQDVIAAWDRLGTRAALIRRGRIHRVAEIRMPTSFQLDSSAWLVWTRLSAVRTAELAVLTLRERSAPGRKAPAAEAWLRRQLKGLSALSMLLAAAALAGCATAGDIKPGVMRGLDDEGYLKTTEGFGIVTSGCPDGQLWTAALESATTVRPTGFLADYGPLRIISADQTAGVIKAEDPMKFIRRGSYVGIFIHRLRDDLRLVEISSFWDSRQVVLENPWEKSLLRALKARLPCVVPSERAVQSGTRP